MSMNTDRPGNGNATSGSKAQNIGKDRSETGTASGLQGAVDAVGEVARSAVDQGASLVSDVVDTTGQYYDQSTRAVGRQVRNRPLTALFVAGAVGYGVAWLFHTGQIPTDGVRRAVGNLAGRRRDDRQQQDDHQRHRSGGR